MICSNKFFNKKEIASNMITNTLYYTKIEMRKISQTFAFILLRTTLSLVRGINFVSFSPHTSIVDTSSRRPETKSVSKDEKRTIFVT